MQARLILVVVISLEIGSRAINVTAQAASQQDFELASIKRSEPGNARGSTFEFLPGGGLRIANGTLLAILETAYAIFTALEETLGLRLESIKGPVDSLIIDHAERPSEN